MATSMTGSSGYRGSTGTGRDVIPRGYSQGRMTQFTPEQMGLLGHMYQHADPNSFLSRLANGDESLFQQIEAPAMRQFDQLQRGIGSLYSGYGSGGRRSSSFQNAVSGQAADLSERLQAQRLGLQRNAIMDLREMAAMLLGQRPEEKFLVKKQQPWWKQALLSLNERGQDFAASAGKYAMMG